MYVRCYKFKSLISCILQVDSAIFFFPKPFWAEVLTAIRRENLACRWNAYKVEDLHLLSNLSNPACNTRSWYLTTIRNNCCSWFFDFRPRFGALWSRSLLKRRSWSGSISDVFRPKRSFRCQVLPGILWYIAYDQLPSVFGGIPGCNRAGVGVNRLKAPMRSASPKPTQTLSLFVEFCV